VRWGYGSERPLVAWFDLRVGASRQLRGYGVAGCGEVELMTIFAGGYSLGRAEPP
jgi:hypothetical protein